MLTNFFPLKQRSLSSFHDPVGFKLLRKLWLKFHLNERKFFHSFKDYVTPLSDCVTETETAYYFFFRCQLFANERKTLHEDVYQVHDSTKNLNGESLIDVLLYDSDGYSDSKNKQILLHINCYIESTKRFERPLIDQC